MSDIVITRNSDENRFEAHRGETLLGFLEYVIDGNTMDLPHTRVFPEFEGQGVASTMAKQSMDMVRVDDPELRITPSCTYMDIWFKRHKNYQDMLAE